MFKFAFVFILISHWIYAQNPIVSAGPDKTVCPNVPTSIGGSPSASGGTPPYSYQWLPTTGLSNPTSANPTVTTSVNISYTLTVQDNNDSTVKDVVNVFVDNIVYMGAGPGSEYCYGSGSTITLGWPANYSGGVYTFDWTPGTSLNDSTLPRPTASPSVSTTYTLSVNSPSCGTFTSTVQIEVHHPTVYAGADTTIEEGQTITLHADPQSGGTYSWWGPIDGTITYANTPNPDVEPRDSTYYMLTFTDENGCTAVDYVYVHVKPGADCWFYNTFTPNGDGNNDFFYIGNLEKYPENRLEIYNRYGLIILNKNNYQNDWDGKYLGQEVPAGTYFYIFDTKSVKGKYRGTVTIIR
jgi:gliding motility-associated-like protein